MKHEPRPAIHMEKPLVKAWISLKVGWGWASGNHQGGANSVSQVHRVSDTAVACQLCQGEESEKEPRLLSGRKLPLSSYPHTRHFSSSLYGFPSAAPVLELRGSDYE